MRLCRVIRDCPIHGLPSNESFASVSASGQLFADSRYSLVVRTVVMDCNVDYDYIVDTELGPVKRLFPMSPAKSRREAQESTDISEMIRISGRCCMAGHRAECSHAHPREARGDRRSGHLSERRVVNPGGNTSFRE